MNDGFANGIYVNVSGDSDAKPGAQGLGQGFGTVGRMIFVTVVSGRYVIDRQPRAFGVLVTGSSPRRQTQVRTNRDSVGLHVHLHRHPTQEFML
jgi:hypothetical protein